ncbi:hypothetical protein KKG61_03430 [bacterium]|nr:hypothetical protein [bacterium]MBU1599143.1 hypothetical protein [bacterium]MBU2462146.1 hypothetical protein [bacterium]
MRKWQKIDKEFRKEIEKRLCILREKMENFLKMFDRKCKLKESKDVILLLKKIDKTLDIVRFTRHRDAGLAEEEDINHKILSVFEIMSEIERLTEGDQISAINLTEKMDFLIKGIEERESLIRAFLEKEPPHHAEETSAL